MIKYLALDFLITVCPSFAWRFLHKLVQDDHLLPLHGVGSIRAGHLMTGILIKTSMTKFIISDA